MRAGDELRQEQRQIVLGAALAATRGDEPLERAAAISRSVFIRPMYFASFLARRRRLERPGGAAEGRELERRGCARQEGCLGRCVACWGSVGDGGAAAIPRGGSRGGCANTPRPSSASATSPVEKAAAAEAVAAIAPRLMAFLRRDSAPLHSAERCAYALRRHTTRVLRGRGVLGGCRHPAVLR